jgi:hypothetical protein
MWELLTLRPPWEGMDPFQLPVRPHLHKSLAAFDTSVAGSGGIQKSAAAAAVGCAYRLPSHVSADHQRGRSLPSTARSALTAFFLCLHSLRVTRSSSHSASKPTLPGGLASMRFSAICSLWCSSSSSSFGDSTRLHQRAALLFDLR